MAVAYSFEEFQAVHYAGFRWCVIVRRVDAMNRQRRLLIMAIAIAIAALSGCSSCDSRPSSSDDAGVADVGDAGDSDDNVVAMPTSMAFVANIPQLAPGETFQAQVEVQFDDGTSVINPDGIHFVSLAPSVAAIDDTAVITAVDEGRAPLRASYQQLSASTDVRVVAPDQSSFDVLEESVTLVRPDGTKTVEVEARDVDGEIVESPDIRWSSSDRAVVVATGGELRAVTTGDATVTARWRDFSDTVSVSVKEVSFIDIEPRDALIFEGEQQPLTLRYFASDGEELFPEAEVEWSSSDEFRASIDASAVVHAHRGGRVSIVAESLERRAEASVTIDVRFDDIECYDELCTAISENGYAYAFGDNVYGELDRPPNQVSSSDSFLPIHTDVRFTKLAPSSHYVCGLDVQGRAYCWGDNYGGRLGFGTPGNIYHAPGAVDTERRFIDIYAHHSLAVALTDAGELYGWGYFPPGEYHPSSPIPTFPAPTLIDAGPWDAIAKTIDDVLCMKKNSEYWCLGHNDDWQLGQGGPPDTPRVIESFQKWSTGRSMQQLVGGMQAICGLDATGVVWCAGKNRRGIQGYPYDYERTYLHTHFAPTQTSWSQETFDELYAGGWHMCGRRGQQVWCWGGNDSCQLGWDPGSDYSNPAHTHSHSHTPVSMNEIPSDWIDLSLGLFAGCILNADKQVWCWGLDIQDHALDTGLECDPKLRRILPYEPAASSP